MPARKPWQDFAHMASPRPGARRISPDELVDMASYRAGEHGRALSVFVAYAQDNHLFDPHGLALAVDAATYRAAPRVQKLNKFGKAYRYGAKLWLHRDMADIVIDAAMFMQKQYGWRTIVYDGLRTVDGAYNMYLNAAQSDLDDGLLSAPGLSAHNKGMAADLMMFDAGGRLVDLGGHFDHLDMPLNNRNNRQLPAHILENRRHREIAFQHAALSRGRLFAPLRSEYWDERFPENEEDLWRVLESLSRCLGRPLLSPQDELDRRAPNGSPERERFIRHWERMSYEDFTARWNELFNDSELRSVLHLSPELRLPPAKETIIYHGDFHPLYDRELKASGKHLTDNQG